MPAHIHPAPQHVDPGLLAPRPSEAILAALGGRSMQDPASELPRTPLLGTTVNKVAHKLGTASLPWDAVPFEVAVRLGWLLPCLPGDRRRCGGRRRFGDRFGLLCFVHAASEEVAHPDGSDHDTNKDQYPVVPYQVEVHQHRGGRYGERSQGAPGGVVHRVSDGGRPNAARVDPQVPEEEARRHDRSVEQGHEEQHVAHREELGYEVVKGYVPCCPRRMYVRWGTKSANFGALSETIRKGYEQRSLEGFPTPANLPASRRLSSTRPQLTMTCSLRR